MNKHIAKIFVVIIMLGMAIYLISEFPNIVDSVSVTVSNNNLIKFGTARNSDYFKNIISVGEKYNQR